MNENTNGSSDTYADFTLSRLPADVSQSLTDSQYFAIRSVLVAQDSSAKHSLDIRLTIPFFLRRYYFVFFAGRDRRASTHRLEKSRLNSIPYPAREIFAVCISLCMVSFVLLLAFSLIYNVKVFFGIDLFPNFHLSDTELLPKFLTIINIHFR